MAAPLSQKYDRQLRIWGEHGQARLSQARVCLLNAGPTGSEALKNLVLGGIGEFTVVDGAPLGPPDLGTSFLADHAGLGQPRARVVCALLQELNDSVAAKFVEEDPAALIAANPQFFSSFTLVIATQMSESSAVALDNICRGLGCPLIVARSYGLAGSLRISVAEHCVVEAKPDNALHDLRLHKPWRELQELAEAYDLDTDDSAIHSHTPFVIILLKALAEWGEAAQGATPAGGAAEGGATREGTTGGGTPEEGTTGRTSSLRIPTTSQEKASFKEVIKSHRRALDEENYKEALASAFKVWAPPAVGPELRSILADPCADVTPASHDFWVLVAALKGFMENEGGGDVPLEGSLPDMHSFTDSYVSLQKVYRARAEADVAAVEARVQQILKSVRTGEGAAIPRDDIKLFCKNARDIRLIQYRPLKEEYSDRGALAELHRMVAKSEDPSQAARLYILFRAVDQFQQKFNHFPGSFPGDAGEEDVAQLKAIVQGLAQAEGLSPSVRGAGDGGVLDGVWNSMVAEVCRWGGSEIHCVGAVMGGIASQEAIKLITKQFVPVTGTFIYNAMSSTSSVLSL